MAYFNRKEIIRILAEKPDMMMSFPAGVLSKQQQDEIACIPDIALCDITMMPGPQALDQFFLKERPDAVVPVVVYSGTERVRWSVFDSIVQEFKRKLEHTWHVHVLQPIVLGAPLFRKALSVYSETQADHQKRLALQCAACTFYRTAVCIPLCKKLTVSKLYLGGMAPCCFRAVNLEQSAGLLKYCKILLSGYGIELAMPSVNTAWHKVDVCPESPAAEFECFAESTVESDYASCSNQKKVMKNYFENFAIPFAANIMSSLLGGNTIDFDECARSFIPAGKTTG